MSFLHPFVMTRSLVLFLTAREAVQVYVFFRHHFDVSVMSQHFSPSEPYQDIMMLEVHPPIFEPYVGTSSEKLESDPFMATHTYSPETSPSKPTSLFAFPSDSVAISSTRGSCICRKGCGRGFIRTHAIPCGRGCDCGHGCQDASVGWGNGFISS